MATELQQTKGSVRFEGKIVGFDPEQSYREGETKSNALYRSISTVVKTSNNNVVYNVDSFGMVPKKRVKIFSNKGGQKQNLEIDFDDRDLVDGEYQGFPDGFTCFGFGTVATGFTEENGKLKMKNYYTYDGVNILKEHLENDMPVWVDAEFNVDTYKGNDGETKTNVKYTITRIGKLKTKLDFDDDDYKEVSSFEQEFVVIANNIDRDAKKLYVTGRIIGWDKSWKDVTFVIDANKYPELANNFSKKTKFGDVINVQGKVVNGTVLVEVDETAEIDWGGETPEGQGKKVNRSKVSELQITKVLNHKPKVYKDADFVVEQDPFNDNGKPIDISDEDLPF